MPRLWVWTWSPSANGAVATPIAWPYLRTVAPAGTARTATLCPRGTPGRSRSATATSSPGCSSSVSPVMHGSVLQAVHRQVGRPVVVLRGGLLVDVDTEAGFFGGVHQAVREAVGVREDGVGGLRVGHVLLDAEVRHRDVQVQRGGQAHRGHVRGAVRAGAHLVQVGQVEDP